MYVYVYVYAHAHAQQNVLGSQALFAPGCTHDESGHLILHGLAGPPFGKAVRPYRSCDGRIGSAFEWVSCWLVDGLTQFCRNLELWLGCLWFEAQFC